MKIVHGRSTLKMIGLASLLGVRSGDIIAHPARTQPTVQQQWKLGGDGGWDYLSLDSTGRRLFVTRATRVDVIDTASGQIIGNIANTNGVHGVALAPDLERGYTSNGNANSVTAFDLKSLKPIKEIKIRGENPDAILYEPNDKRVFTFDGKSKDVTVIDAVSLEIIATLPVPDKPEFAADGGDGNIYVNIESERGQMAVIDSHALSVKTTWSLAGCATPSGLAIDRTQHRLFSVCDANIMVVTDSQTGKQVARVAIGEGPDAAAYDAKRGIVYSSNGDGTLTVIQQEAHDHYRVVSTLATQRSARTMALDPLSGKVYLAAAKFGPAPPAKPGQPLKKPPLVPDSFTILVAGY